MTETPKPGRFAPSKSSPKAGKTNLSAPLPVIFRKHYCRSFREWTVTAFFPTEPGTCSGDDVTCYQHVGQHGQAALGFMRSGRACSEAESADLLAELRGIYETPGPGDDPAIPLKVYRRKQPWMREARRKALRAARESVRKDPAGAPWTPDQRAACGLEVCA